jgi:hypothetical protein
MKRINITRDGNNVEFERVSVVETDTVFFVNLDPLDEHKPNISEDTVGPFPSLPSSECQLAAEYSCEIEGHGNEKGFINILPPLAPPRDPPVELSPATKDQPIAEQQVVTGGMSPYKISGEVFEVTDAGGMVIQHGSGIGPGLHLNSKTDNKGISVSGTPTLSGTYNFTFTVDDAMGGNLQQVQYLMTVV